MPDLAALFNPGSIAVVGASKGTGPGENVIRNILTMRFPGPVYPINPKYDELQGLACYPSLEAVPEPADLVVVALASRHVPGVLEQAARVGARAAVVFSAGFAEMGDAGTELQREIARIARESGLAVVGPNCLGLIQPHNRLALVSASLPGNLQPGAVALVAQSGSIAIAIMNNSRGIGFSHIVSSGNEAALDTARYVEYFAEDPQTQIIVAFVEGIRDGAAFRRAADSALAAGKPLIVLKVGRSEGGRRATLAHTGSLSGSDAVHDAVFRRHGIIRVADLDELFETLELFTRARPAAGDGVGVISLSGGQLALISDLATDIDVRLADLHPATRDELRRVLPPFANPTNPVDVTGVGVVDHDMYRATLQLLADDPNVHVVAVSQDVPKGLGPRTLEHYTAAAHSGVTIAKTTDKPLLFFTHVHNAVEESLVEILHGGGVPLLQGTAESLKAINHLIRYSAFRRDRPDLAPIPRPADVDVPTLRAELADHSGPLSESESKALLRRYGIPVPEEALAGSPDEAVAAAERIGYPVVLKIASADIPHKSDAGGVRLGLRDASQVVAAYREILANCRRSAPDARIDGISVQAMVSGGQEAIVGLSRDALFGHTVLFGLGGIFAEVLEDVALRLLPVSPAEAEAMVRQLRGSKLFEAYRGRPRLDLAAVVDTILRVSQIGSELGDLVAELDINPLVVLPQGQGVRAVDALVVLNAPET